MRAFILAGGFATRLWPLTEKRAKPLLPLAGKPLITYLVEGIPEDIPVTVSTNAAFRNGFAEWTATIGRNNLSVIIEDSDRDDHKLGALGATAQWIVHEAVDDDLLLLTGDNYCGFRLRDFLDAAVPGGTLIAAHDIGDRERAKQFGTVITDTHEAAPLPRVTAFEEKPRSPKSTLVNTGCSLLPGSVLPILVEYAAKHPDNVGGIFEELLRRNIPVDCFTFAEPWFDIGSFEAYLEATRALVGRNIHLEKGTTLDRTQTSGSVVIGRNSAVRESDLEDVVMFENCTIEDCVLKDCIIDRNCRLRGVDLSGKMLREGTELSTLHPQ